MLNIKIKPTVLILTILFFLGLVNHAHAATEFVSIVDTGGAADSDYSTLSTWENAIGTNLTAPSTIVFSGVVTGTAPSDGASVTLYRSGSPVGVGATVVHTAKTQTRILLKNVSDSGYAWAADDQWRINDTNYFQIDAVTKDQPQVTAKCRATTGAADTTGVTISGWDTDATHYIKIWTDPAENYRHQGKWDVSKYRLEISGANALVTYEEYARIDGLQIAIAVVNTNYIVGINAPNSLSTADISISNNIIKGAITGTSSTCRGILTNDADITARIWNNIIFNFSGGNNDQLGMQVANAANAYVYNNTLVNNNYGLYRTAGTVILKNNLSYNNTDNYFGAYDSSSANNLSGPASDAQTPGTAPQNGVTVTFADAYNNDFHLDSADTGAKNQGIILYDSGDDANLYFTTDIDNETRKDVAGSWDIGADENVAKIYRSVGAGATSPIASGGTADSSYGNMEIKPSYLNVGSTANLTDYIATFWRPLPDNVGVGDALNYDADNTGGIDNTVFITKRIDSTHYSVRKADGTAPTSTSSVPNNTWAIYRSYTSLSDAEAGTENVGIGRTFDAGNLNLTTNNLQWNIACYANGTAPDTTAVTIYGWTTTADNYMRVYTPTRTDEVGTNQRHEGVWDTTKYYLQVTDASVLTIQADYMRIDGLQMTIISPSTGRAIIYTSNISANNDIRISNNIVKGHNDGTYTEAGISIDDADVIARIWNNIIYDIPTFGNGSNRGMSLAGATHYVYNNTIYGTYTGIRQAVGNTIVKNNLIQNSASDGYLLTGGTWDSSSAYNLSDDTSAPGTNPQNSKTVSFADSTNKDFHLAPGDSVARNIGADLTNDLYLPINSDIDSTDPGGRDAKFCVSTDETCLTRPRGTSWDIGADELITKIYRSVGVGTTAAIISGTSPAISLTISGNTGTFSTFPTSADFGVGDVIRYDSDNNGTLDSTAFISAIDSTAKTVTLQNSTGGAPTIMAVGDFDWKLYRAHTSLSDWEAGTANTGIGVTFPGGNRDIATNSEQWNVACYANSGTAPDTTGVSISGWTTAAQNYIKVYTPTLSSEVTTSQRHQGKWDTGKYSLQTSTNPINIGANYIYIDGLQTSLTASSGTSVGIDILNLTASANKVSISNSIIVGVLSSSALGRGIYSEYVSINLYFYNNVVYGWSNGASAYGMRIYGTSAYVYNNTFYNCDVAILANTADIVTAKNNIAQSNVTAGYQGTFNSTSTNNLSDHTDAPGSHSKNSTTVSFVDSANYDFHLATTDTAAKDAGADLSKDLYLPITNDIDSQSRERIYAFPTPDIGADEAATAIYRSLAPSATGSIASGTNPANSMIIAGTSVTFGTAPGDTIGVGDAIQYDSDNNGSIDSVAFITYRTDSTHYKIQDRTGQTPTSTSATDYDWSIFRAYTSLQNASGSSTGGTENTGLSDNIEHFDIDWAASHGKNIYTYNQQWNVACYTNSTTADTAAVTIGTTWTTYPTNYIRVYTPTATTEVGTSQRHQGTSVSGYKLNASGFWSSILRITANYVRVDGLIITYSSSYTDAVDYRGSGEFQLSNNIVYSTAVNKFYGVRFENAGNRAVVKIWNNVIYDMGVYPAIMSYFATGTGLTYVVYNNTVYNCGGVFDLGAIALQSSNPLSVYAKNNVVQKGASGYKDYSLTAANLVTSNNISSDATSPNSGSTDCGGHSCRSQTVTFADSANYDFHLGIGDTAARNSGADLSSDPWIPASAGMTSDIDGHTRPTGANTWDIGADEGATAVYYSVGQSTSTDFKVASNVSVSGYTATFTQAQTGNIGVGDIVTYTGGSCYITGKTSTSIWSCQNATGGTAPQVSGVSVTSIKRAFASLNSSISGSTAPSFLNTSDLKTNNYILNIPCYMDSGTQPDTTAVTIQGYTTGVPNYLRIYTPNNTTNEVNQSQRHQGKWDDAKYNLTITGSTAISNKVSHIRYEGLQMKTISPSSGGAIMGFTNGTYVSGANEIFLSNSILKGHSSGTYYQWGVRGNADNLVLNVWNVLVYGIPSVDSDCRGIELNTTSRAYNVTVIGGYYGIRSGSGSPVVKNSYAGGSTNGDFSNVTLTTSASSDTTGSTGLQSIGVGLTTFTNVTSGQEDYHLASNSSLKNVGTNLSSGTYPDYAFSTDIDGNTRNVDSKGWDIGADEAATAIYYSVGQSSSDLKTGSPTLSIDSSGNGTLSVSQTGNMGVGDYIEYGTSPYAKAYITGKTSATVWTVQSATGSMLGVATTEPVNSIKHSYTTLNGAIAGASGSTMMNTTDLYTNNLQLNVPCYMDSGTADTTAVTISGYTTALTNYVRIYTPMGANESNNSQRHSGKWDEGKYKLVITGGYAGVLDVQVNNTYIDGLQIKRDTPAGSYVSDIYGGSATSNIRVSNNILTGVFGGTTDNSRAIYLLPNNSYIWNNIIYGFRNGSYANMAGILFNNGITCYVYNNTIYNNYIGIRGGSIVIAKNNLSYNNTYDYSGSFDASSTNNLSKDATSPNTALRNKTVNFVDSANYDFHLAESDTAARNSGADLSTDAINRVPTDIDGNSRPTLGAYDIGADEGSTYIYYSVGQNTSDHKTLGVGGSTPTITLSGYSATLDVAQTAPNIGVGDKITYTGGSCYISAKTSDDKMHWNCQNATGGTAPQVSGVSVTSITHAFSLLGGSTDSGALSSGSTYGARNSSHLNTSDLYANNYILNIPCYYDSGADTTKVPIASEWTTYASNYIKVYTPNNTSTEVNTSQRHDGKWNDERYRLEIAFGSEGSGRSAMDIYPKNIKIEGLQIKVSNSTANSTYGISISTNSRSSDVRISSNIIKADTLQSGSYNLIGINGNGYSAASNRQYIWNNVIYDFNNGTTGYGIYNYADNGYTKTQYIYNNTIYNCYYGIRPNSNSNTIAKNNIVQGATTGYYGTFDSSSTNNIAGSSPSYGAFGAQADSGTTTSSATNKLIQTGQNFTQTVKAGMIVKDSSTNYSYVTAIDSDTQLSLNDNIMSSSEAFTIYTNRYGTVAFEGTNDNNFHLSNSDTLAKNNGVKLATYSDDSNLNFTTDIDGNARAGDWSIGADDGPYAEVQSSNLKVQSLTDGLVGYWSFDGDDMKGIGIGGTAIDRSGNGNDGILAGTAPGPTAAVGKRGQALSFDGTDDYASVSALNYNSSIITVSFWFNFAFFNKGIIFESSTNYNYNNNTWAIYDDWPSSNQITAAIQSGSGNYRLQYISLPTTSTWHYLTVVFDNSTTTGNISFFMDGQEQSSTLYLNNKSSSGNFAVQPLYFMARAGVIYHPGFIDEARIYNRALSSDEIGHLYRMGQVTIKKDLGNAVIKK